MTPYTIRQRNMKTQFFFTVYFFANLSRKLSVLKTVFNLEGTILKTELFENEDITITV